MKHAGHVDTRERATMLHMAQHRRDQKVVGFRLDDHVRHAMEVKFARTQQTKNFVLETFVKAWVAKLIDPRELDEKLKAMDESGQLQALLDELTKD